MANSLPVIATVVGSIPHIFTHNENIMLIEPKDVNSIVTAINELINNSSLRKKIIERAYPIAREISIDNTATRVISVLDKK
jgi:glycosyltransferase involved in cell wall biosynthesis